MVAILSNQREVILDAVRRMYTDVATVPERGFHFPTGRAAGEFVGYPAEQLDAVPSTALESFAGVGYPFAAAVIRPGDTVLDIGSGAGTDALIASALVGAAGRVIGLDMTDAMREKLWANAAAAGVTNIEVLDGNAEDIPLPNGCVDVVTTNGVLNLVPDKARAIREIARVLASGGRLQLADIVVASLPSDECRAHPELWAECVVGATTIESYLDEFFAAGLRQVEVIGRVDYFSASSSAETRKIARSFGAHSIVLRGRKT
ncbi:MAG: methyltransferase domain-containing protein [Gemmatimonadaceae bacterium]